LGHHQRKFERFLEPSITQAQNKPTTTSASQNNHKAPPTTTSIFYDSQISFELDHTPLDDKGFRTCPRDFKNSIKATVARRNSSTVANKQLKQSNSIYPKFKILSFHIEPTL
jgi:hypothetical protein